MAPSTTLCASKIVNYLHPDILTCSTLLERTHVNNSSTTLKLKLILNRCYLHRSQTMFSQQITSIKTVKMILVLIKQTLPVLDFIHLIRVLTHHSIINRLDLNNNNSAMTEDRNRQSGFPLNSAR